MTKNITSFKSFRTKNKVNELVEPINDVYRVTVDVDIPKSLINAFAKKVKDQSNKDIRQSKSEMQLAELIVRYVNENFIVIENLPVDIVVSSDHKAVQSQVQTEPQDTQLQTQPQVQTQPQGQTQPQTQGQQVQVQTQPQGQIRSQDTAQEISAQEI